jgi:hypothetical protein
MQRRLVAALSGLLVLAALLGAHGAGAAAPQLRLNLNVGRFLEVITASGTHIRTSTAPGTVIPPGTYAAVISTEIGDAEDTHHMFHLSGPGQNLQTDLLGGDNPTELYVVTLQPSSTYVFEDDRNSQYSRVVFSTSAAPAADTGSSTTTSSPTGSSSTTKETSNTAMDLTGSRVVHYRGALAGSVTTAGKLGLTFNGKKVSSLRAGRYKVSVLDETAKTAFTLQRQGKQPVPVSGRVFVGRRTMTLTLKAGQWVYYSTPARKSYFVVVA